MMMEDLIRRADVVRPMLRLYRYLRKQEKDGEKAEKIIDKAPNAAAAACVKECVTTAMEAPAVRVDTWIGTERQKPESDAVQVVRCENCFYACKIDGQPHIRICANTGILVSLDYFCPQGRCLGGEDRA